MTAPANSDGGAVSAIDSALISELGRGSAEGYRLFVEHYDVEIQRILKRLGVDAMHMDDVRQEILMRAFRRVNALTYGSDVRKWLLSIIFNECHTYRRWMARRRQQEIRLDEVSIRAFPHNFVDKANSPFLLAAQAEERKRIHRALNLINKLFRDAIVLRDLRDFNYEQMAVILHVSLGTVKSRILRGREMLRRVLEERNCDRVGKLSCYAPRQNPVRPPLRMI
jgi:RNA polymerase sigma-70 factor, ECF subfamily